ncbi:anhydro-N-acetylmuramic acid kinase [Salegentibacter sp. F188]|uniref:Anhydro-N-acetylmuramic acid kinase n=1 Tax=Autumnicola patrickiae TaxID=3075591 RepID=A0ABU3E673_9FLAO|nr:anhydro-N-acetylmuramic acid kinase [Salegentibacter sp. F188]MDT0691479.1 anhydro-N-acetylmuramic acid kinase [Salegentibacter sp. F188]
MKKSDYKLLGVMSGTSLDGIDVAVVEFSFHEKINYKILKAETIQYTPYWKKKLSEAINFSEADLQELNLEYTSYLAEVLNNFIEKNKVEGLDAICSHGHTIKHEPQKRYTLQIGNYRQLAELTGHTVVCDFRVQDVELGGQGAPLVPIGDRLLFPEFDFCLNLGGFANISTEVNNQRIAYDICAVNTVLNFYAQKLDMEYDEGGKIAASGEFKEELFNELNRLSFYSEKPPKSLGMEWVNSEVFPLLKQYEDHIPSLIHTYSKHVAFQISEVVKYSEGVKVLVTGGGAFNDFLIDELKKISNAEFVLPSEALINFKEALIFAFLGALRLRGENNVLKSVTGAEKDHSSGRIYNP